MQKTLFSSAVLGLVISLCLGELQENTDRRIREGQDAIYRLEYELAAGIFQQLIQQAPDNPVGYGMLAITHWNSLLLRSGNLALDDYATPTPFSREYASKLVLPQVREVQELFHRTNNQLLEVCEKRLVKNPKDTLALYFKGVYFENLERRPLPLPRKAARRSAMAVLQKSCTSVRWRWILTGPCSWPGSRSTSPKWNGANHVAPQKAAPASPMAAAPKVEVPTSEAGKGATAATATTVGGTVNLSDAMKAKAAPTDTVFIFARAAEGSRMPLALTQVKVSELPAKFALDDTMAMSKDMKLSSVPMIVVGARVSKSGRPMPSSGDLEGLSKPVAVGTKDVAVTIDRVLP